jgi:hypothetical protein
MAGGTVHWKSLHKTPDHTQKKPKASFILIHIITSITGNTQKLITAWSLSPSEIQVSHCRLGTCPRNLLSNFITVCVVAPRVWKITLKLSVALGWRISPGWFNTFI